MRTLILPVLAVLTLANCNMNTAGLPGTTMATNGSLSVEAIRLQASSEKLLTLEQEQEAARKRWIDAHLQVKLVDKLRKRARERFQTELVYFEQRQLDDRQPRGGLFSES